MGHNVVFQNNNKQKNPSVCVELFKRAREKKCFPAIPMWLVNSPLFINSAVVDQIWRDDSDELRYDHLCCKTKNPHKRCIKARMCVCRNFPIWGKSPLLLQKIACVWLHIKTSCWIYQRLLFPYLSFSHTHCSLIISQITVYSPWIFQFLLRAFTASWRV